MKTVSLRVVVVRRLAVALVVMVVLVVLVRVGRSLQVLVRVHVMMAALLLPRRHHVHHVTHGVHVAVRNGAGVVRKCSLQPLRRHETQRLTTFHPVFSVFSAGSLVQHADGGLESTHGQQHDKRLHKSTSKEQIKAT